MLEPFHVFGLIIGVGHVARYPVEISQPADAEVAAQRAEPDERLVVTAEVHVVGAEHTAEHPPEVRPELALRLLWMHLLLLLLLHSSAVHRCPVRPRFRLCALHGR